MQHRVDSARFTTKGLKPVTAALIRRGRGILKRKPGERLFTEEWAEQKRAEEELEGRHRR